MTERVGPYRIERLLGRGGMGTVYLAVREDDYEHRVALKLVNRDAGNEEIVARFYTERQILARLQHPGIARLLDGGVSDDGWPYFVMEYVEGERIDRYCNNHGLSLRERIELFRRVCGAVQFAHQNLVVHRDIKAGNIMITADGHPRLLDFGIAKVLQPEHLGTASTTMPGLTPMTPSYASPEQIKNEPITTACDVYALGVLLYRLLAGRPPYCLDGLGFHEIVEVICRREPKKPSAAVFEGDTPWEDDRSTVFTEGTDDTTISLPAEGLGKTSSGKPRSPPINNTRWLSRRLAGDLDAIVLKALRKEPRDRYGSAADLAEDLRRHLVGLPVLARQGTWSYTAGKFLRRNRLGLAILLVIVSFAISTTFLWRQAVEERAQAKRQQTRAERVTEFMEDLFKLANPDEAQGKTLTVYEILRQGRARVAEELEEEPEIQAEILGTLASVYGNLGQYNEAVELRRQALEVRQTNNPTDRPVLAKDINNLAHILYVVGDYEGAEQYFRNALAMRQRLGQGDAQIANNLLNLAATLVQRGIPDEAEKLHHSVLATYRDVYGPESPQVATSLYSLGALSISRGDFERAEPLLRQAVKIRTSVHGPRHTAVAEVLNSLGRTLHMKGELEQAKAAYEEALAIRRERLGDDHARVAQTKKNLATLLLDQGDTEKARELIDQALATLRRSLPEGSIAILDAERVMGAYLVEQRRFQEAERYLVGSYLKLKEIRGQLAIPTRDALNRIIALYDAWDRHEEAAEYRAIAQRLASPEATREKDN